MIESVDDSDETNSSSSSSGSDDSDSEGSALSFSSSSSSSFSDDDDYNDNKDDQARVEFDRRPRVFDDTATIAFYISPLSIAQLATGLWTRSRPACVIINTRLARATQFDDLDWSPDALRMLTTPNAGGSSLLSEVLSLEMLSRCLGARLAKTEMEMGYLWVSQPMTDYSISLPNLSPRLHVGVSVTRAFSFKGPYRREECRQLLWKKLTGILASTKNLMNDRFFKQILHIWVPDGKVARTVQATYKKMPVNVKRNTVVVISVVNAPWVFSNRRG
ncbi:hypothetical protein EC968_009003 [Mortierella alpina]|nr:hypothetical protein EC968_009003 [Mortierella alpina]